MKISRPRIRDGEADRACGRYSEPVEPGITERVCLTWCRFRDVAEAARGSGEVRGDEEAGLPRHRAVLSLVTADPAPRVPDGWTVAAAPRRGRGMRPVIPETLSREGTHPGFRTIDRDRDVV